MFRSHVDTPWQTAQENGETVHRPELPYDPLGAGIKSRTDVTGAEGQEVEPGKVLYGGNYAKVTGIQPDYSVGRLGGSGDPDWLTLEIITDTISEVDDIDGDDRYLVLWTEEIIEDETQVRQQNVSNKNDPPDAATFGQWRSKMARRGVPQAWIDKFLGTGINGRSRGRIALDLNEGYTIGQIAPGAGTVDMSPLVSHLTDQGWRCFNVRETLWVLIEISGEIETLQITEAELLDCAAHATNRPSALWFDIHNFTVSAGYCT